MNTSISAYFNRLGRLGEEAQATDNRGAEIPVADAIYWTIGEARAANDRGNKIIFVGNGGSAAVASHMAIDYSKNGGIRAVAFNDGAALTCLGNDFGYEYVFAKQIEFHGQPGDLLVAISSSGRSQNILEAVRAARAKKMSVLTLSGFSSDSPLRQLGNRNIYLPDNEYGFVEIGHLMICHAILDLAMGWTGVAEIQAAK